MLDVKLIQLKKQPRDFDSYSSAYVQIHNN